MLSKWVLKSLWFQLDPSTPLLAIENQICVIEKHSLSVDFAYSFYYLEKKTCSFIQKEQQQNIQNISQSSQSLQKSLVPIWSFVLL
jgi:hypothetical protein